MRRLPLFTGITITNFTQIYCEYGEDILSKSPYFGVGPDSRVQDVIKIGADVVSKGAEAALLSSNCRETIEHCVTRVEKCASVHGEKPKAALFRRVLSRRS